MRGVRVAGIGAGEAPQGRERLLDAAVRLIAREGIDNVRIARIATEAGVSAGLVHYHFASRDALLEEALEHSYERAGDLRLAALEEGRATAGQRLAAMIDQCLPTDRALHDDFVLWVELWLRSARDPALRPVAAPGARLAYWNLFAPRHRPTEMAGWLVPRAEVARALHLRAQAFFYGALVLEVAS